MLLPARHVLSQEVTAPALCRPRAVMCHGTALAGAAAMLLHRGAIPGETELGSVPSEALGKVWASPRGFLCFSLPASSEESYPIAAQK